MEINNFGNGKIRIKDDIDISQSKWDFIFNSIYLKDCTIYFIGWRLDFIHGEEIKNCLDDFINGLALQIFIDSKDHSKLLFKVNLLDRKVLHKLWQFMNIHQYFSWKTLLMKLN